MPTHLPKPKTSCPGPECDGCDSPECYAEGGSVTSDTKREDHEKGINRSISFGEHGISKAGLHVRAPAESDEDKKDSLGAAKVAHHKTIKEMRDMPRPKLLAEGGEVHEDEEKDQELIDNEINEMMGEELMSALDGKDKKRIMESLEAIVLHHMNKE